METTAPLMDSFQHLLAYAVAAGMFVFVIRLMGGLEKAWDAIDISENIGRFQVGLRKIKDGGSSIVHAIGYGFITLLLFGFAWHFDLSSSWEYSDNLRKTMATTMGSLSLSTFILAGLTYLPTVLEMFGAKFAKLNVFFVQIAVIGLSAFDLFTDRARVKDFIEPYYGSFVNADNSYGMNILFEGLYYFVFGLWWILASYGFELLLVCFAFATIGCIAKGFGAGKHRSRMGLDEEEAFA